MKTDDRVRYKARNELGTVVRFTMNWVFVLYDGDNVPKATRLSDLEVVE